MTGSRRGATLLAAGSAGSGLLAYGVFAVVTRTLGPETAAPVSVLWTWWGFAAAAVTFPIQHWATRSISAHGEASVRHALRRVTLIVLAVAAVAGAASWLGREALFHSTSAAFPTMVALLTLGAALVGLNRGALAARGRFAAVGASLVAENGLRLVAVCVLAGAGVQNAVAYGLCLVLGYLAALAWPGALRFADGPQSGAGSPFAFLAGAGFGQLASQVVLTGGPVVLALSGGSAVQVTSLFAALALFRAPYLLAQGSVAPLTVRLTGWAIAGDREALTRVRRGLVALAVIGIPLAGVVGWWLGPVLLPAVFGEDVVLAAGVCAVVAAACAWAVVNLLLMIDVMAHGRAGRIASVWTAALLGGGAGYLALLPQGAMERSVGAFLVAEAVAWVALLTALPREEATTAPR